MGRGTTGIVSGALRRNFTGIDLYSKNVAKAEQKNDQ
jgi:DNA modification methylase